MSTELETPESLEAASRREEAHRDRFERNRDARNQRLARDAKIRRIAREESQFSFYLLIGLGCTYLTFERYGAFFGWLASAGIVLAIWLYNRGIRKRPEYASEEIEELAEDAVTHERVIAFEALGTDWMQLKGGYAESKLLFDAPYWEMVNKRVREFERKTHKERQREVTALKAQSLPIRKAILAKLRSKREDIEFPNWFADGL